LRATRTPRSSSPWATATESILGVSRPAYRPAHPAGPKRLVVLPRGISAEWPLGTGAVVEEGNVRSSLEDHVGRFLTGDDLTEAAIRVLSCPSPAILSDRPGEERPLKGSIHFAGLGRADAWPCLLVVAHWTVAPGPSPPGQVGQYKGKDDSAAIAATPPPIQFQGQEGKVTIRPSPQSRPQSCKSPRRCSRRTGRPARNSAGPRLHHQLDAQPSSATRSTRSTAIREPRTRSGHAIYHFKLEVRSAQAGRAKVNFTAKHK